MNVLSLFSGIGGLELGLERAGMTVVGQVEIDPWCRRVLAKHWPKVARHDDVRTCVDWWRSEPRPAVHLVAGGFPCQPFSTAGRLKGTADERWGWPWHADVVRALRPGYVLVENVAALLADRDAFGQVLADLAEIGYDAEWDCIPAAALGAPHRRDRVFLVAHAQRLEVRDEPVSKPRRGGASIALTDGQDRVVADTYAAGRPAAGDAAAGTGGSPVLDAGPPQSRRRGGVVADSDGERPQGCRVPDAGRGRAGVDVDRRGPVVFGRRLHHGDEWEPEPAVGRVADGVPSRVDRLRGLGNAVVPQVSEYVGRLIVAADRGVAA